jgi:hypothetical protein
LQHVERDGERTSAVCEPPQDMGMEAMGRSRLDADTGPEGCECTQKLGTWKMDRGPPATGVCEVAWRADHMHSSRFLERHLLYLLTTVRHSPSTLPLCLRLRVIPLVFLVCSAVTCLAIAPGCTLPSLPLLDP